MAGGPTDFLRLYQELGLAPGANIDELRRAYRRRVSELHPDRLGQIYSATVPGAAERLQHITALYSAATQFHRQHGRLPGSVTPPPPRVAHEHEHEQAPAAAHLARPRRRSYVMWLVAGGALIACLIWMPPWSDAPIESDDAFADPVVRAEPQSLAVDPPHPSQVLKIGMTVDKVLAIQGAPLRRDESRWDYGPSWISFEKGKVSDWYSSTLRPLKFATRHPPPPEALQEP